jgi:hypothetical protein
MEKDSKVLKAIGLLQGRLKIITDLAVKGIIFHLAISAFAVTFAFQNSSVPKALVQLANILITFLAFVATILIINDVKRIASKLLDWHLQIELQVDKREFQGIITVAKLYAIFCLLLIAFWIALSFVQTPVQRS